MNVLALELSTARGSLALTGDELLEHSWANDRRDSGPFFRYLNEVFRKAQDVQRIIVGVGPGSYSGVRIAIATAVGLRKANGARLQGIPSICAMETEAQNYFVVGDARRHSFYLAEVEDGRLKSEPVLHDELRLRESLRNIPEEKFIFSSDDLPQFERIRKCYPSARRLAALSSHHIDLGAQETPEPIYLRPPHITLAKETFVREVVR